jgi:hypothetical protein
MYNLSVLSFHINCHAALDAASVPKGLLCKKYLLDRFRVKPEMTKDNSDV